MKPYSVAAAVALIGALGLGGCQSASKALGMSKVTPDEFRVVTKAPLIVPPDFSLRPPAPGEPRPTELQPESAARAAYAAAALATNRSAGEQLLASKAGAAAADPLIRFVVDDEFGDIAHKEKSFADRVMFWRKDQPKQAVTRGRQVVDAAPGRAHAPLTGGKAVIISAVRSFKLNCGCRPGRNESRRGSPLIRMTQVVGLQQGSSCEERSLGGLEPRTTVDAYRRLHANPPHAARPSTASPPARCGGRPARSRNGRNAWTPATDASRRRGRRRGLAALSPMTARHRPDELAMPSSATHLQLAPTRRLLGPAPSHPRLSRRAGRRSARGALRSPSGAGRHATPS